MTRAPMWRRSSGCRQPWSTWRGLNPVLHCLNPVSQTPQEQALRDEGTHVEEIKGRLAAMANFSDLWVNKSTEKHAIVADLGKAMHANVPVIVFTHTSVNRSAGALAFKPMCYVMMVVMAGCDGCGCVYGGGGGGIQMVMWHAVLHLSDARPDASVVRTTR